MPNPIYTQMRLFKSIEKEGSSTLINGVRIKAIWQMAQPQRVQNFNQIMVQNQPAYEVFVSNKVLYPPYNLSQLMTVVWEAMNWSFVVRAFDPFVYRDEILGVRIIVEMTSE